MHFHFLKNYQQSISNYKEKKNGNAHRATQFFFVNSFEYNLAKCVNETEKNCSYSELDLRKKAAASKQ